MTYFWINLFTSFRITANWLIDSNLILIANKELKKLFTRFFALQITVKTDYHSFRDTAKNDRDVDRYSVKIKM
jgi:hypothetical protein